jgi:hypothetical protein
MRPGPTGTVINFDPATGQTTSGERRHPYPVCSFCYSYGRARLFELKIQLCRFIWFERRIINGSLHGTIHNQCHPVIACRKTLQTVTAVYIRFNRREQSASGWRFNPDIRALNRLPLSILDDSLQYGIRGRCACDKKHDLNKSNPNRFDKHNKKEGGNVANAQYPVSQFRCGQFACYLVLFGRAFGLPIRAASHVEKAFSGCESRAGKMNGAIYGRTGSAVSKQRRRRLVMPFEMMQLDRASSEPLHQQLYRQIREELESGSFDSSASRGNGLARW